MEYQLVEQNRMGEFDDLEELEENKEEEEAEEDGSDENDIEKGVKSERPSLLFTPSVIRRRSAIHNLHQVPKLLSLLSTYTNTPTHNKIISRLPEMDMLLS